MVPFFSSTQHQESEEFKMQNQMMWVLFFWFVNESRVKLTLENVKNAKNYSV